MVTSLSRSNRCVIFKDGASVNVVLLYADGSKICWHMVDIFVYFISVFTALLRLRFFV